jgi:hypothetical protein
MRLLVPQDPILGHQADPGLQMGLLVPQNPELQMRLLVPQNPGLQMHLLVPQDLVQ